MYYNRLYLVWFFWLYVFVCIFFTTQILTAQEGRSLNSSARVMGSKEKTQQDPNFPEIELEEVPLEVPRGFISGSGYVRSEELYRNVIIEVSSGYFASMLGLFNINDSDGNSENNTRETEWNNLYNILVGLQISGDPQKVHYNVWFAMPFNLGLDTIEIRDYEFGSSSVTRRNNKDISFRGTFTSQLNYMLLGGGELGFHLVNRKSAKLTFGGGIEAMLAEWEISGGNYWNNLQLNLDINNGGNYDNGKSLKLLTGQLLPFAYLQAGAFVTPFLEISARVAYSPVMLWFSEETRFRESTPNQYRRYGYFGQTVLGEVQARLWFGRRYALKLGVRGRYTFKTPGTLRVYEVKDSGDLVDESKFSVTTNGSALQNFQISVFLGLGIALDTKLPPGRRYEMPF